MFDRRPDPPSGRAMRQLLSVDTSARALAEAERDCADLDHVMFRLAGLPEEFPDGTFDLIMLSEVLYYMSRTDLVSVATQCAKALAPEGEIVLCHWLGETNYPLTGDEAAEGFISAMAPRFRTVKQWREPEYRLDLLARQLETAQPLQQSFGLLCLPQEVGRA